MYQLEAGVSKLALLRFSFAVVQLLFAALPSFCVYKRDLLKARVIIHSYDDHVRLLPPEPWFWHHQVYSGRQSRHCYEINPDARSSLTLAES